MRAQYQPGRLTHRATVPAVIALALLLAALSTGSPLFLAASLLCGGMVLISLISVLWTARTLSVETLLSDTTVQRGSDVSLEVAVRCSCPIPVSPLLAVISAGPDRPEQVVKLSPGRRSEQVLQLDFHASHVGVTNPGVRLVEVRDLLCLFQMDKEPQMRGGELIVLPLPFDVGELTYAQGESGAESMARASEDISSPSDVRAYQHGDAMKKIHWKLSMRKQELLVRRYEEPVMPDSLILLDSSAPPRTENDDMTADLKDALLETAASVMHQNVLDGHPAKLPVHGDHPIELDKGMGMPMILEALARVDFSAPDKFERMLHIEMRRMRKVGCTVVISARLNSRMVDVMTSMRRMGPYVRLYLIAFDPEDPRYMPMIGKLQMHGVEVCFVTPVNM